MTLVETERQFVFTTEKLLADAPPLSDLTVGELISLIKFFPDCHLPKDILFESYNEKKLIKTYKNFYKGLSVWLEHLAAKKRLSLELVSTNWRYFEPHAQIHNAQLNLATGVHSRSILYDYFESPVHVWGSLIYIECKDILNSSGLFGKPLIDGKVETIAHNLERHRRFDERKITAIPLLNHHEAGKSSTYSWDESPQDYLTVLASDIAQQDPDFDRDYWVSYKKTVSKWERKIRDCEWLQAGYLLPNGDLFITEKGKTIPKQFKSQKGFGHSKM